MIERDLFVAAVSIGLGACILYTLFCDQQRCFEGPFGRRLADRFGQGEATGILFGIIMLVIFLGLYILLAALWPRMGRTSATDSDLPPNETRVMFSPER